MPDSMKYLVLRCVVGAIDGAIHDLLFTLQDSHDRNLGVEILVDGKNVAEVSDGLHGEPNGEQGWIARFSQFPEQP